MPFRVEHCKTNLGSRSDNLTLSGPAIGGEFAQPNRFAHTMPTQSIFRELGIFHEHLVLLAPGLESSNAYFHRLLKRGPLRYCHSILAP
jgi:hypothetical protein